MVRSGAGRNLPLHILGGILIALFGIPLGFGGVAVLVGILATLAGMAVTYLAGTPPGRVPSAAAPRRWRRC